MKIGIDARLWSETGVGRYIRNLVKELQIIDKKNEYILFVRKSDYDKVNNQITNDNFKTKMADIRWHTVGEQLKFAQILNKENLDLMHFPYFSVPVNYKRPFIITIHDLILNHFPTGKASTLPAPLYQLKRIGYKYVLSNAIENAKKIIVPLNAVKEDVLKSYNVSASKIVVTYEGVDSSLRIERSNPKEIAASHLAPRNDKGLGRYFLYVGNAYPHKNLEKLIEAFRLFLDNRHPGKRSASRISKVSTREILDTARLAGAMAKRARMTDEYKLILVGKDDFFYKRLEKKVLDLGFEKEIIFHHDVTDEELANFYNGALAFISPSLMEGFGLPALEAMSLGCLVLVSDIPSFKEVCQETAIYFDSNSVDDIKNKMFEVYALNNKLKQQQIKRGLMRVKLFSWKLMTEQTLEVYNSINKS